MLTNEEFVRSKHVYKLTSFGRFFVRKKHEVHSCLASRHLSSYRALSHGVVLCHVTTCHMRRCHMALSCNMKSCHMALSCVTSHMVIWNVVTWRCLGSRHHLSYGTLSHGIILSYGTLSIGVVLFQVTTCPIKRCHMALSCVTSTLVIWDVITWNCLVI